MMKDECSILMHAAVKRKRTTRDGGTILMGIE
jgi:hypothetical protein